MTLNNNGRLESKSALMHAPAPSSPLKHLHDHFSETTKGQIKNLTKYFASTQAQQESRKRYLFVSYSSINAMTYTQSCKTVNRKDKPTSRIAGVLVLLFEREGHLRVLLTTRAKRLVHGGETCLPGGHMEDADRRNIEVTAVRPSSPSLTLTHSLRRGIYNKFITCHMFSSIEKRMKKSPSRCPHPTCTL